MRNTSSDRYKYLRQNPTHEFFKVFALVIVASVAAVFFLNIFSDAVMGTVPIEVEKKIFGSDDRDRVIKGEMRKLLGTAYDSSPLDKILYKLADQEEEQLYNYRIFLVCEPSPNAFALPGGDIMVTAGLILNVKSEHGLAAVIGHEIGHFYHRHHIKGLGKKFVFASFLMGLGFDGMGSEMGDAFTFTSEYMNLAFDRQEELDADAYGLELMAKAYGTINGASEFFEAMAKLQKGKTDFLSTHPLSEKRLEAIAAFENPGPNVRVRPLHPKILTICSEANVLGL